MTRRRSFSPSHEKNVQKISLWQCMVGLLVCFLIFTRFFRLHGLTEQEEQPIETKWSGTVLPPSLSDMKDITSITLSGEINSIPSAIFSLTQLTMLNVANNKLIEIPSQIGFLTNLELLGLKNNHLESIVSEIGLLTKLKAIFLTSNHLQSLPSQIGEMKSLRKLQAGSNQLKFIPTEIGKLKNLELFRMPMNQIDKISSNTLSNCESLAWIALSENPFTNKAKTMSKTDITSISMKDISLKDKDQNLASSDYGGAANDGVIPGSYHKRTRPPPNDEEESIPVAVKYFTTLSPDGDPWDELLIGEALSSSIIGSSHGLAIQYGYVQWPRLSAVFRLIPDSIPMAMKPLDQVRMLRGRFVHKDVSAKFLLGTISDLTDALAYMHSLNIAHGDIYAHNILIHKDTQLLEFGDGTHHAVLFDFGASFFYSVTITDEYNWIEAAEVRAFGLLLHDMVTYFSIRDSFAAEKDWLEVTLFLEALVKQCTEGSLKDRPSFARLAASTRELATKVNRSS